MDDSLVVREQELFKINEKINFRSPKLFNKNESLAIPVKTVDKEPVDSFTEPQKSEALECTVETKPSRRAKETPNVVPKILERHNINKDNLIRFLKSKVAILQDELDTAVTEHQELNGQYKEALKESKKQESVNEQQKALNATLQQMIHRLESKIEDQTKSLAEKDKKITTLSRNEGRLQNDVEKTKNCNKTLEKRLHKALTDIESLKEKLNAVSTTEKEIRSNTHKERKTLENQIKDLKKERISMLNAFKKQLLHIEAIKKQNNCMDESKLIEIAEQEYMKLLDWASNNE